MNDELTNDDILKLAFTFGSRLSGDKQADWQLIEQHIRNCDVLYGVWDLPHGRKARAVLKGQNILQLVSKTGAGMQVVVGAIPCSSAELAEAIHAYIEQNEPAPITSAGTGIH